MQFTAFFRLVTRLKHVTSQTRVKLNKNDLKGSKNSFELKSILVRVSEGSSYRESIVSLRANVALKR